jgi:hypothetical protein
MHIIMTAFELLFVLNPPFPLDFVFVFGTTKPTIRRQKEWNGITV